MFPTSVPLKKGQKPISLDKMPFFYELKPGQQLINLDKMPKFSSNRIFHVNLDSNLALDFQELSVKD